MALKKRTKRKVSRQAHRMAAAYSRRKSAPRPQRSVAAMKSGAGYR